jgi:hypothetical protein
MKNTIETKPTCYNNYNFRSRTEARWAVFFDALKYKYHYEYQDFILENGQRYLPDFYLSDLKAHVEIKHRFTQDELNKCLLLSKLTNEDVFLLEEAPDYKQYQFIRAEDQIIDSFLFYPEENRIWVSSQYEDYDNEKWFEYWQFSKGVKASRGYSFENFKI